MSGMKKSSILAREKWAEIIQEQGASGSSVTRFCAARSIPASSFFAWKRKLSGGMGAADVAMPTMHFVEAKIARAGRAAGATDGGVAIECAGGRMVKVVRGFDCDLLLDVITALESDTRGVGHIGNEAQP